MTFPADFPLSAVEAERIARARRLHRDAIVAAAVLYLTGRYGMEAGELCDYINAGIPADVPPFDCADYDSLVSEIRAGLSPLITREGTNHV